MLMDEVLVGVAEKIKNFAVPFLVDITEVPDFNSMCTFPSRASLAPGELILRV